MQKDDLENRIREDKAKVDEINTQEFRELLKLKTEEGATQREIASQLWITEKHVSDLKLGRAKVNDRHLSKLKEIKGK